MVKGDGKTTDIDEEIRTDGGADTDGIEYSESDGSYFCCECLHNHRYRTDIWDDHREYALRLPKTVIEALGDVAMDKQIHRDELIVEYVEEGLKSDLNQLLHTETDDDLVTDGGTGGDDTERCDYCDGTELVYEFEEATRGRCYRCIRCLALEQAQNQQRPLESYGGLDDELLQHAWQQTRDWLTILCRLVDDDPIIKRDPDTISTVEESTRTFLTNVMGADAHRRPSELRGEQA